MKSKKDIKAKIFISNKSMKDNSEELIEIKDGKQKTVAKIKSRKKEIKNEMER